MLPLYCQESGVAASSALAKLTNRLNFLKERRAQLASEMQNLDLGRPQAQGPTATAPPKRDSSWEVKLCYCIYSRKRIAGNVFRNFDWTNNLVID